MFIRPYGDLPRMYAPDIGEVIEARRTPADQWTRAAVIKAHRNRQAQLQVKVQWLADDPHAGGVHPDLPRVPIKAGTQESIVLVDGMPPLLRSLDGDMPWGAGS